MSKEASEDKTFFCPCWRLETSTCFQTRTRKQVQSEIFEHAGRYSVKSNMTAPSLAFIYMTDDWSKLYVNVSEPQSVTTGTGPREKSEEVELLLLLLLHQGVQTAATQPFRSPSEGLCSTFSLTLNGHFPLLLTDRQTWGLRPVQTPVHHHYEVTEEYRKLTGRSVSPVTLLSAGRQAVAPPAGHLVIKPSDQRANQPHSHSVDEGQKVKALPAERKRKRKRKQSQTKHTPKQLQKQVQKSTLLQNSGTWTKIQKLQKLRYKNLPKSTSPE